MRFFSSLLIAFASSNRVKQTYESFWASENPQTVAEDAGKQFFDRTLGTGIDRSRKIYKRCSIRYGLVYAIQPGVPEHPKPVDVVCSPGYKLVLASTDRNYSGDLVCQQRKLVPAVKCKKKEKNPRPEWKPNCPQPIKDGINVTVVDMFNQNQGKTGYVFRLDTQMNGEYSVAFQYPSGSTGANFQTWNLDFFNFYPDFVLFHSQRPWKNHEKDDPNKTVILVENLDSDEMPRFHLFEGNLNRHECFRNIETRAYSKWFIETRKFPTRESIRSVSVNRVTGQVLPVS
ncbi:Oidioi.mRNA.OKI2018_I69.chr2.g4856.t1.cds [Oikopleura dioica]|uniref:Oidioi.mRNA.OKI2018_I69.chr2.g4856.t1.cds n=1 Tax=Oikopleura dioica TaxID=34765 RepID=A0ABN7T586_OIKDI|nr:Oidioi.mRNA.OKI2018_I69.chr2.g4856.t1.cds [Oikopleura dioica]